MGKCEVDLGYYSLTVYAPSVHLKKYPLDILSIGIF